MNKETITQANKELSILINLLSIFNPNTPSVHINDDGVLVIDGYLDSDKMSFIKELLNKYGLIIGE